jgi:hypothetical protein
MYRSVHLSGKDGLIALSAKVEKHAEELVLLKKAATASGRIQLLVCAASVIKAATGAPFKSSGSSRISSKMSTPEVAWFASKAELSLQN